MVRPLRRSADRDQASFPRAVAALNLIDFFPLPAVMALKFNGIAARVLMLWPVREATERAMDRGCFELGVKGTRLLPIG